MKRTLEVGTALYMMIAAVLSGIYVLNTKIPTQLIRSSAPVIVPLALETAPRVETASQISPDGKMNLIMKVTDNNDGTYAYEFTTEEDGAKLAKIYSAKADSKIYSVPFNAWSPNDKYLFIYKGGGNSALVFRADGKPFSENEQYIDLGAVFKAKYEDVAIKEVTGWADPALIVFNQDGKKASYWLEIPSKAIIPLSTNFYD